MKKIFVYYTGSYINTTSGFAIAILLVGIVVSFIVFVTGLALPEPTFLSVVLPVIYIIAPSFIAFIVLMSLSKILQHLLYARVFQEVRANEAGYEVTETCYEIAKPKPEE